MPAYSHEASHYGKLMDTFRPGIRSLAALDRHVEVVDPPSLRFSARIEWSSDKEADGPWIKEPVALEPGQPIAVKWEMYVGMVVDVGTTVTARIEYGSHILYTSPPVPIKRARTGVQQVDVVISSPVVANMFYKLFGSRELKVVVTGNGSEGGPYTRKTVWTVVPPSAVFGPPFSGYWFSWSGGREQLRAWKEKFLVGGVFTNQTRYTALQNVHLALSEETLNSKYAEESSGFAGQHDFVGPIPPGGTRPHQFQIAAKDFYWMEGRPVWAPTAGGHFKWYRYRLAVTMNDIYGNRYADLVTEGPTVQVKVSAGKEAAAGAAAAAAASAFTLSAAAVAATIGGFFTFGLSAAAAAALAAAASVAYATAEYFGRKALDPPEPDHDFFGHVDIEMPPLPAVGEGFDAIAEFFRESIHIVTGDDALTAIEGKLLGAQLAQSEEGIAFQSQRYDEVRGWIVERYHMLEQLLDPATEAVRPFEELWTSERLPEVLHALANGFPDDIVRELADRWVPNLGELQEAIATRELADLALTVTPIEAFGIQMQAVTFFVRYILRYRPDAMSGIGSTD